MSNQKNNVYNTYRTQKIASNVISVDEVRNVCGFHVFLQFSRTFTGFSRLSRMPHAGCRPRVSAHRMSPRIAIWRRASHTECRRATASPRLTWHSRQWVEFYPRGPGFEPRRSFLVFGRWPAPETHTPSGPRCGPPRCCACF